MRKFQLTVTFDYVCDKNWIGKYEAYFHQTRSNHLFYFLFGAYKWAWCASQLLSKFADCWNIPWLLLYMVRLYLQCLCFSRKKSFKKCFPCPVRIYLLFGTSKKLFSTYSGILGEAQPWQHLSPLAPNTRNLRFKSQNLFTNGTVSAPGCVTDPG